MRRLIGVFLFVVLAVSAVAVEFDVSIFPSERTIKANETATFEVELEHTSPVEELFEVFSTDVTWDIRPGDVLRVGAGKSFKTGLFVRPLNLNPGAYNVPVTFKRSGSLDTIKKVVYVEVLSPFPAEGTYLPAVRGIATVDRKVDPREALTIKLSLENQNLRELDQVDIKVRSDVLNKDYTTSLGPREKKTLTFEAELDVLTPPQQDALEISIIVPGKEKAYQFDLFPIPFEVVPYGAVVSSVETDAAFLKWVDTVTLTSEANRELAHLYKVPAWFAKRWFVSSDMPSYAEDGRLVWEVPMRPGEVRELTVVYNYRPLFWLFVLALALTGAYYVFRSPIRVEKKAKVVDSHEGGITELKVVVEVMNRGNKPLQDVLVMDLAPHLVDVVKGVKGLLEPSKIEPHGVRGTLVKWDLGSMEPKEQRVLTYNVKTKLGVLGGLTLPVTAVKFKADGKERETVSNKPEIRQE